MAYLLIGLINLAGLVVIAKMLRKDENLISTISVTDTRAFPNEKSMLFFHIP
jgi:hypothetical protein